MTTTNLFSTAAQISEYATDEEYRATFKQIFEIITDADPEDAEFIFENTAINDKLEYIFDQTKNDSRFNDIYTIAAGKMLSEDPTIGMYILFSFDYLYLFYNLLQKYNNGDDDATTTHYIKLKEILSA
jgi:hypothetical protein